MRQAGKLTSEHDADRLAAYLMTLGIRSRVEGSDGQWTLWVFEENELVRSRQELQEFLQNPSDPRYAGAERRALEISRETAAREKQAAANIVELRTRWNRPTARRCPLTLLLILASVGISMFAEFGDGPLARFFWISGMDNRKFSVEANLPEVREGDVWRLVTPIFVHMNPLHLAFNMYWLFVLGGMIESRRGTLRFALLVIVAAIVSNVAQYVHHGPAFGGMSGVVYALFGYIWMKSLFDPRASLFLPPNTVFLMVAWFFLCMTGAVGPVANMAHGVGLGAGMLWGYLPTAFNR